MNDFRTMFPGLDVELIESVLRANGGTVDDTIDQLLTITVDCSSERAIATTAATAGTVASVSAAVTVRSYMVSKHLMMSKHCQSLLASQFYSYLSH